LLVVVIAQLAYLVYYFMFKWRLSRQSSEQRQDNSYKE
jgi:hypothetical protein